MVDKHTIKYLVERELKALLEVEEPETKNTFTPVRSFEEDPMMYILNKYPSLAQTLSMLLTDAYKDYITGIYIVAPKPTTFRIVLHNNQTFILTYLGKSYEAKISGKRYYLTIIGERQRAIIAIAGLLELGAPLNTKGPGAEETAASTETSAAETPSQAEEEKTES